MTSLNEYSKFDNLKDDSEDDSEDHRDNVPDHQPQVKESMAKDQTVYDIKKAGSALHAFINDDSQVDTKGGEKIILFEVPSTDSRPVAGIFVPIDRLASWFKSNPQGSMVLYYGLEFGGMGGTYELKAAAKDGSIKGQSRTSARRWVE